MVHLHRFPTKRILKDRDVLRIFARCFRYLIEYREFATPYWSQERSAQRTDSYNHHLDVIGPLMHFASSEHKAESDKPPVLSRVIAKRLADHFDSGNYSVADVFPALVAFMTTIDEHFGQFGGKGLKPNPDGTFTIQGTSAFPKPRTSLTDPPSPRVPQGTVHEVHRVLEQYFSSLTVTPIASQRTSAVLMHQPGVALFKDRPSEWKIALLSILSSFGDLDIRLTRDRFSLSSLSNDRRHVVEARLAWALAEAARHQSDLVVIPELNADTELQRFLVAKVREFFREAPWPICVLGELHVKDSPGYRNRPIIVTGSGQTPWPYTKINPMMYENDGASYVEDLRRRRPKLVAMDTPAGRVAVLICLDFTKGEFKEALRNTRANLVIVPSMTTPASIADFVSEARQLCADNGAVTVFCNSSLHLRRPEKQKGQELLLGFIHPHAKTSHISKHSLPDGLSDVVVGLYTVPVSGRTPVVRRLHTSDEALRAASSDN